VDTVFEFVIAIVVDIVLKLFYQASNSFPVVNKQVYITWVQANLLL
jgi:hypothetical protein